jgi:hypothetical protein
MKNMGSGKIIQIHLPDGNPKGIKICEIPNSNIKAVLIPRNLLNEIDKYEKIDKKVSIYFLFSDKDETSKFQTYIGEAEEVKKRLKQHDIPKEDYWNYAVCFMSGTDNLNKAHIKFLESYCHEEAMKTNVTELKNCCSPTRSTLSTADRVFVLNFYEELKLILGTLGYPIFESITKTSKEEDIFYCKSKDAEARGNLTEEGFVVYKGSKARLENVPSLNICTRKYKEALIRNGIIKKEENYLIFTEDTLMNSPSRAGEVILGRPSNGWEDWKNKEGKTLDELKRKGVGINVNK